MSALDPDEITIGRAPIWQTLTGLSTRLRIVLDPTASAREADACSIVNDLAALADEVRAEISRAREEGRREERSRVAALLRDLESMAQGDAAWHRTLLDTKLGKAEALAEARKRLERPVDDDAQAAVKPEGEG